MDIPLALPPVYMSFPLSTFSVGLSNHSVLLVLVSLPCDGRMGCVIGQGVCWIKFLAVLCFAFLTGLKFPCIANFLITVGWVVFIQAAPLPRFLVSAIQALCLFCSFLPLYCCQFYHHVRGVYCTVRVGQFEQEGFWKGCSRRLYLRYLAVILSFYPASFLA